MSPSRISPAAEPLAPLELVRIVGRHKKKCLLFFFAAAALTVAATALAERQYRSESKLFVRLGRENVGLDATATLGQSPMVAIPFSREDEINSVVRLLEGRQLSERVVDAFGPEIILGDPTWIDSAVGAVATWLKPSRDVPSNNESGVDSPLTGAPRPMTARDRAILSFERSRGVEAVKKTNVIEVSYKARSPQLAQAVLDKFIEEYLSEHVRINRTAGSRAFLEEQASRLRRELTDAEDELRAAQRDTGIASPGEQRQILVGRIGRLEDELLQAETAFYSSLAEAGRLRASLAGVSEFQVIGRTVGLDNSPGDGVRQQLYDLQLREQELLARFTPEHPEVLQIRRQIAGVRSALSERTSSPAARNEDPPDESRAASASLASSGKTGGGQPRRDADVEGLIANEPVLASLEAKAERLRSQLADAREELESFQQNELRIARLEREIGLRDASYRKYADSLEQANIDRSMEEERISNINVAQPATYNPKPVSPRVLLNLALGFGFAFFGGLGLAFLAERSTAQSAPPCDVPSDRSEDETTSYSNAVAEKSSDAVHANGSRTAIRPR